MPVGGGGLIAGIAAYVKRLRPDIKIMGVEPSGANALYQSLRSGRKVVLDKVDAFADGVAVKTTGEETLRLCRELVDDVVLCDTDEICVAIKDMFEDTRSITEPSGALAVAGAKKWLAEGAHKNKRVVAITSGANMNFDKLRLVADRAGSGDKEEAMLTSTMKETKGEFRKFIQILSGAGISRGSGGRAITEFKYRYNKEMTEKSGNAKVFYAVDTASREDTESLVSQLNEAGLTTSDLTKNELAVRHVRYMSGGGTPLAKERFFRVAFPERPGALRLFLDKISDRFNISLFHYRFSGDLIGNVFLGIAPMEEAEAAAFQAEVAGELGWDCEDMTENDACDML